MTINSFSALADSCNTFHHPATCATVAADSHDPTYPIINYVSPSSSLSEFNTAGKTTFSTSCGVTFTSSKCINMVGTVPPPSLPVVFKQTATLKAKYATLTPITLSSTYKRITLYQNNTVAFDVTGGHAQTVTWQITSTQTTTLNWYALSAPTVTCSFCSSQTWTGSSEVLVVPPGISAQQFTLVFTGQNLACLCAIAETVNPVGDLSAVVAKELEFSYYWAANNPNFAGCSTTRCFGFFLTTNSSLWQTNNPNFDPYTDQTVALLDVMTNGDGNNNLYVQLRPGEPVSAEDTGCKTGSLYLCGIFGGAVNGVSTYFDLNYTGASTGSQVGSGASCPITFPGGGGPGCSYIQANDCALGGCGITTIVTAGTPLTPKLPITGVTYYAGFWVSSLDTGTTVSFCFDTGAKCSAPQTPIVSGCVTAAMELDSCVPNPVCGVNALGSVTDSGGFVGSALRFLSGAGQAILGLGNTAVSYITTNLAGPWNAFQRTLANVGPQLLTALFGAVITLLNTLGGIIGITNLGSLLLNFLANIASFFGLFFTNLISELASQLSAWNTILSGLINLLGTYWTNFNNWMIGTFNFLSFLWTVANLVLDIPFAFMFTGWMFYGILRALRSLESWWGWYHTTGYFVLLGLSVSWYLFVLMVNHIIIPIVQTITAMSTTEQAVKPDLGAAAAVGAV